MSKDALNPIAQFNHYPQMFNEPQDFEVFHLKFSFFFFQPQIAIICKEIIVPIIKHNSHSPTSPSLLRKKKKKKKIPLPLD